MHVILTVAGRSERFWPLQDKALVPICGTTPMEHQLSILRQAGLTTITIVASRSNETQVRRLAPDLPVVVQEDDGSLGTRGALLSALPHITDEWVLVVAGTDLVEISAYESVLAKSRQPGVDGVFLAKQMTTHFPGGYISVDGDRIVGIVEKPKPGEEPSDLVNIVIHAHKRAALVQALADIPDLKGDGYSQVEQLLMQRSRYELARYTGTWYAFKYPWDAIKALPLFRGLITKPSIHPTAKIHPSAVIEGPVVIDEGASVLAHAIITGPVYIGPQSVVGYGTIVRGGSIGHHCAVNGRSEIKNCVLYPHVWTHGTYLGDSVIAENVSFGNGCNAGNLRLDEDEIGSSVRGTKLKTGLKKFGTAVGEGCRFGFGVGLYPGVKVGRHTFVASHALLTSDVPEKRFIHVQNGVLDVRENTTSAPHPEGSERSRWKQEFDQR